MITKMFKLWFVILFLCGIGAYLNTYLQTPLDLKIPGGGIYTVSASIALISAFFLGTTLVTLYFSLDFMKNSLALRRVVKNNKVLQKQVMALSELLAKNNNEFEHKSAKAAPVPAATEPDNAEIISSALLSKAGLDSNEMLVEQRPMPPCARKPGFFSFLGPKPAGNGKNKAIKITSTRPADHNKDESLEAILGTEFTC